MREHRDAEHIDQRNDRDHCDRGQRQPDIAIEVAGDRERHMVCQRVAPWKIEVKAGPSIAMRASSGRKARQSSDIASAEIRSAPPTPATGTLVRSAFTSVWIKSIGNST